MQELELEKLKLEKDIETLQQSKVLVHVYL